MKRVLLVPVCLAVLFSCVSTTPEKPGAVSAAKSVPEKTVSPERLTPEELARQAYESKLSSVSAYLSKGELGTARESLKTLMDEYPEKTDIKILYASTVMSAGNYPEAKRVLSDIVSTDTKNVSALYVLSEIEYATGNVTGQKALLDTILKEQPDNTEALAAYGDLNYNNESYVRAAEFYRKSLASDPKNSAALVGLGRVLFRDHKWDDAERNFREAIIINEYDPEAWAELGRTLYQKGNFNDSLAALDKAVEIAPNHGWYYYERAQVYLSRNRREEALADFTRSIKADPSYFLPYVFRAGIYEEQGNDEGALSDYRSIVSIYPDYYYAFESIGVLCFKSGVWDESRAAFAKAYESDPMQYEYAALAAVGFLKEKKIKETKEYLLKILPKIDREKAPLDWMILRMYNDFPGVNTTDIEMLIGQEKKLDRKALALFFLAEYWSLAGRKEIALKYFTEIENMKREGSFAERLSAIENARLQQ